MFNLRKYSTTTEDGTVLPGQISNIIEESLDATKQQNLTRQKPVSDESSTDSKQGLTDQQKELVDQSNEKALLAALQPIVQQHNQRMSTSGLPPVDIWNHVKNLPEYQRLQAITPQELARQINNAFQGEGGVPNKIMSDYEVFIQNMKKMMDTQYSTAMRNKRNAMPGAAPGVAGKGNIAFNLQRYIEAQNMPNVQGERFPVASVGEFIEKFLRDLMAWNGNHKERDAISARALEEIRSAVGQGFEEEANSALKTIQRMGSDQVENAAQILAEIYEEWLSPIVKQESENQAMAEKIEGIVKYNLSDHVLNNIQASGDGVTKTASANQSQEYTLYGPTEKRVCPKLRGRNSIGGDVVSEYICRHHCNMGLVIDDNKTVCGEAVWRANVMDKFSREYVDADGNVKGGYIEKRFEVNHNVPEENKMRLKPGEIRKPRPAEMFGNLEARMQAMRNKEGKERGYRPETDTSKPFNWVKDIDQNNVEVAQKERDRREEASGHETVQYTNKNDQENNPELPKKSFNLKEHRTAGLKSKAYKLDDTILQEIKKGGFNLNNPPDVLRGIDPDQLSMIVSQLIERGKAVRGPGASILPPQNQIMDWPSSGPGPVAAFNLNQHKKANSKKKS